MLSSFKFAIISYAFFGDENSQKKNSFNSSEEDSQMYKLYYFLTGNVPLKNIHENIKKIVFIFLNC